MDFLVPPNVSVSKIVQYIKGYTSIKLLMEFKDLNKKYWGQHLWATGYFAASSGNVTDEVIMEYIRNLSEDKLRRCFYMISRSKQLLSIPLQLKFYQVQFFSTLCFEK